MPPFKACSACSKPTARKPEQQGEVLGGQLPQGNAAGRGAASRDIDAQLQLAADALRRRHGLREARRPAEQLDFGSPSRRRTKGMSARSTRALRASTVISLSPRLAVDRVIVRGGVIELAVGFVGVGHQHMGQPVLRAAIERQGVSQVIAHGLAATGDGDMQFAVRVFGQAAHGFGDEIGGQGVLFGGADVIQRGAVGGAQDVDVPDREFDGWKR
jgi:hypothetical protein